MVAWFALAPRELGGSVSYVITHGISMQPRVHEGDLVLVRKSSTYEPGDVIAYESKLLKRPVMHRIVSADPAGYVTKGDNNDWLDSDRPTDADVIGKEWLHIPNAGKVLAHASSPVGAAALAGAGGLLIFAGHSVSRTRGRRSTTMPTIDKSKITGLGVTRQIGFAAVALGALASLFLGYSGFTADPPKLLPGTSTYVHEGEFTYEAAAPEGAVYRDGVASTGEPLFLKLIDEVDIAFTYRLKTDASSADVGGAAMLWAEVTDGSGWRRLIRLQPETDFTGTGTTVGGSIRPQAIQDLIVEVQQETGVVSGSYALTLMPAVAIRGSIEGDAIEDRFTPKLSFALEGPQMKLSAAAEDPSGAGSDPLKPREEKDIGDARVAPARVSVLGAELPVRTALLFGFGGLAASLAAAWWLWSTRAHAAGSEDETIAARYGEWLIPVAPSATHAAPAIEVTSMDGLVKLAERYERMILHSANGTGHRYMVEDAGALYYYETGRPDQGTLFPTGDDAPAAAPPAPPAQPEVRAENRAMRGKTHQPRITDAVPEPKKKVAPPAGRKVAASAEKKVASTRQSTVARKATTTRKTSTAKTRRPRAES